MKAKQVFKIQWQGIFILCMFVFDTVNPYRLYELIPGKDRYGYPAMHRKQIAKYSDMTSVMYHVYRHTLDKEYDRKSDYTDRT